MNILEFFDSYNIRYWVRGNNVAKGSVNIQCFFCDDKSNHLGINLKNYKKCGCWKCGKKKFEDIVGEIIGSNSRKESIEFIKNNIDNYGKINFNEEEKLRRRIFLPKEASSDFPKKYLKYLKDRGFNPEQTIKKYKLKACGIDGPYCFRIIIPIYQNKKLVSFTSRDITGKQKPKYKASPHCLIDHKKLIFNFDTVEPGGDAVLVEGPFDVMKFGDKSFCFLGVAETQERILEIGKRKINNLYVFLDRDYVGRHKSEILAGIFAPLVKQIHILKLAIKKDPGELTMDEVFLIRESLKLDD